MAYTTNGTITSGGAAQTILASGHSTMGIEFNNESDTAMRIAVGVTASSSVGDNIPAATRVMFRSLTGQSVSLFCVTTGKAYSFHELLG